MIGGDGNLGDCVAINLSFKDGSIATIHYLANGSKDFPKERFEVFAGGRVAVCDNFRTSRLVGSKGKFKTRGQDKGHAAELKAFVDAIHNGTSAPIPVSELIEVTRSTLDAAAAVHCELNTKVASAISLQLPKLPLEYRYELVPNFSPKVLR